MDYLIGAHRGNVPDLFDERLFAIVILEVMIPIDYWRLYFID